LHWRTSSGRITPPRLVAQTSLCPRIRNHILPEGVSGANPAGMTAQRGALDSGR